MYFSTSFCIFLAIASPALCSPKFGLPSDKYDAERKIVEKLSAPPPGWTRDETTVIDKDTSMIKLRIHLAHQHMDKFHDVAMKIATPGHKLYGDHLSQQAIDAMIAPKDESKEVVMTWLQSSSMKKFASLSPRGDEIILEANVAQIEKLLQAKYEAFVQANSGDIVIRTLEYSLPKSLEAHVDLVQPTTFFGLRALKSSVSAPRPLEEDSFEQPQSLAVQAVAGCTGSNITPLCLSNLYNYGGASNYSNGLISIGGFLEEWPIKSDLTLFMKRYATQNNSAESFTCTLVNNGTCPQNSNVGVEANLDVQYARAITQSIPMVYYSVGGRPPWLGQGENTNEPYLEYLNYMLALPATDLPQTLSISYGDDQSTVPLEYAKNVCNLFAQLGARGVSILVSSGDSGVGSQCTVNGTKTFTTAFPASCPWVTTIGGTTGNSPEAAWSGSGGGFSEIFPQPSYQTATINKWLSTDTTHAGVSAYFNSSGRAYPDISAQATNFVIYIGGTANLVDGTSCSAPTLAGIIQLLNSDRLASGKKPLGFLNPWLYNNASSGFTDVQKGKNTGCSGSISGAGFSAVAGWDPATGLGTPNYASLLAISKAT